MNRRDFLSFISKAIGAAVVLAVVPKVDLPKPGAKNLIDNPSCELSTKGWKIGNGVINGIINGIQPDITISGNVILDKIIKSTYPTVIVNGYIAECIEYQILRQHIEQDGTIVIDEMKPVSGRYISNVE